MRIKCLITFVVLVVALVYASPVYAQKPLTKPKKPAQTVPAEKSSSTTSKSNNKSSTTKSPTQSSTSSSSSTQQSQTSSSSSQLQMNKPTNGYINGREYVDLGLSVKWATCNVGASNPSDYGYYYAWGSSYDVATKYWGSTWRLPTASEIDELINKCKHEWTNQGGHQGYKVTGPNGNSIFLPVAGWRIETSMYNIGEIGCYWSSTPRENYVKDAYILYFRNGQFSRYWGGREVGRSMRAVSE